MELCGMHTEASTIKSWRHAGHILTFQELDYEDLERKIAQGTVRKKKRTKGSFGPVLKILSREIKITDV